MVKRAALFILCCVLMGTGSAQTLRVVTELSPPFQTIENGAVSGTATKKVRDILNRSGVDYVIEVYPWATAYKFATTRNNVLIYSMAKTAERMNNFHWIAPTFDFNPHLVGKKSRPELKLSSLTQAQKFKIAVQNKDFSHKYLLSLGFKNHLNLVLSPSIIDSWKLLNQNHVDFIVEDLSLLPAMEKHGVIIEKYRNYLPLTELSKSAYLAANINLSPEILKKLMAESTNSHR